MGDGMIVLDAQNRILDMNPSFQVMAGTHAKEAIVQSVNQVLGGWPQIITYCRNVTDVDTEIQLQRNDTISHFDVRLTPLFGKQKQQLGQLILLRDITLKKHQETEREKLITELREALVQVKQLKGLLPICAKCKKIRDDLGYWGQIESYIEKIRMPHSAMESAPSAVKSYMEIKNGFKSRGKMM